jgi:hypothetical protein
MVDERSPVRKEKPFKQDSNTELEKISQKWDIL